MAIIDSQFRHLKINQHLADMHGLAVVETVGKTFREIMPQLAPILEAVFQEVYTTGKPILNFELSGETASNPDEYRDWQLTCFPFAGEETKPKARTAW